FVVFPGSGGVARQIEQPDPRLGGESIAEVFRSIGGQIRASWCGPCFGQGPDALAKGERAITSFNRNWQNRMGVGGEGYLASPAVVAASALAGYMAPPSELGLPWDPETYGMGQHARLIEGFHMKTLLAALAAFLVAAPLAAQGQSGTDAQAQQPTFRTGVDVITVDVGAIDSRGQPVTDLHAPECTVKIDG